MHHVPLLPALALALTAVSAAAHADPQWTYGGFGTLSAVHSGERQADYTASPIAPGEAGYSRRWAVDVDSRVGAQLAVHLDKRWSAVVQVVSEQNIDDSYRPKLEWANVKYQVTPELSVRAGRIALPLFLAADYRKASYALPWLRTPVELYTLMPISSSDGLDATYRWQAWGFRHDTQVMVGGSSVQMTPEVKGKSEHVFGLTHSARAGALTVRATAARSLLKVAGGAELFDALRGFGPAGHALADRYDFTARSVRVFSGGFNYDPGAWFLMGELGRVNTRSLLGDQTAGYLSAGWRFGTVTPYATYARVRANMATHIDGLDTAGLPAPAAAMALVINGALNEQLRRISEQRSASAGVRWDFAPSWSFKLQLDRVRTQGGTTGTLRNVQPGFRSGKPFAVVGAGVDFVF